MYYHYWYYKRQGVQSIAFPRPVIGTQFLFMKSCMKLDQYSRFPHIEYWHEHFGPKLPKIFLDFRSPCGAIIVSCPKMVNELYVTKNKYFDRHYREKQVGELVIGDSILFQKSSIQWAEKRKHISTVFYKERLQMILNTITEMCLKQVQSWKQTFANRRDISMDINKEILDMLMDETQVCVFGMEYLYKKFTYLENGSLVEISVGEAVRRIFRTALRRLYGPIRELFEFCDHFYLTDWEKELKTNVTNFRVFLLGIVNERREAMLKPEFVNNGDFVTLLLTLDLFKNDDKMILDECVGFMIASTNATSLLISNTIYYLTQFKAQGHLNQIRGEFKKVFKRDNFQDLTADDWKGLLNFDNFADMPYLSNCINETLRIDSPPISFGIELTEPIDLLGYKILNDHPVIININALHYNDEEWQEPNEYIPQRFDPQSKYFLTPAGKKRHPISFTPFLGGKRVCLGKTFAEHITRYQLAIILSQLDFEFTDQHLYDKKPKNHAGSGQPVYSAYITLQN
ncbi:cytochrome p450 [Stylonychia lemnae]|uniref:Cytochrome p450 n=1 Tax=Stylonychia lemnae TaxID=5949 RepID=A0A078B4K9_STYLE|nr:cytochrome p450 [Stylonychia lemnae]|eukprot:CDW89465.1 cytochrome p450 [Stylonychia lemnae]